MVTDDRRSNERRSAAAIGEDVDVVLPAALDVSVRSLLRRDDKGVSG